VRNQGSGWVQGIHNRCLSLVSHVTDLLNLWDGMTFTSSSVRVHLWQHLTLYGYLWSFCRAGAGLSVARPCILLILEQAVYAEQSLG